MIQIRRDDGTGFPNVVGFDPDGVISTNGNRPIGSYMSGARTRVAIEFSETTGKFAFYVDGELRSEDRFITGPFAEFERLYVSFADQFEPPSSMTIDDVRITGLPAACGAADLAPPFGVLDVSDVVKFLQAFGAENGLAHYADPIGTYDIADVVAFLASFGDGCD
ncbi:MAG: hypothetical protein CMJ31_11220 [Phycisphaerae bacterium]|nr:hypothetical protein [Phycisphaerae bacterium]